MMQVDMPINIFFKMVTKPAKQKKENDRNDKANASAYLVIFGIRIHFKESGHLFAFLLQAMSPT
jgi:hypothetical protein